MVCILSGREQMADRFEFLIQIIVKNTQIVFL